MLRNPNMLQSRLILYFKYYCHIQSLAKYCVLGIWKERDDLGTLLKPKKVFAANTSKEVIQKKINDYNRWKRACLHFADFNEQ